MFAASAQSRVFHRLEENSQRTFCGLRVGPFASSKPEGKRLHRIRTVPPDYSQCEHCKRIGVGAAYVRTAASWEDFFSSGKS